MMTSGREPGTTSRGWPGPQGDDLCKLTGKNTPSPSAEAAPGAPDLPLGQGPRGHSPPALLLELRAEQQVGEEEDVPQLAGPLHQLHHEAVLEQLPVLWAGWERGGQGRGRGLRPPPPPPSAPSACKHLTPLALCPLKSPSARGTRPVGEGAWTGSRPPAWRPEGTVQPGGWTARLSKGGPRLPPQDSPGDPGGRPARRGDDLVRGPPPRWREGPGSQHRQPPGERGVVTLRARPGSAGIRRPGRGAPTGTPHSSPQVTAAHTGVTSLMPAPSPEEALNSRGTRGTSPPASPGPPPWGLP